MNQELVSYIERHLKKGISKARIRDTLLKAGHTSESVNAAFQQLSITKPYIFKKNYLWLFIIPFIITTLIVIYVFLPKNLQVKDITKTLTLESKPDFSQMSDNELLKYSADNNTTDACEEINDIYKQGLCNDYVWDSRPCYFKRVMGDYSPC